MGPEPRFVHPHLQIQISSQLVSQLQSNSIRSIIGVIDCLHYVFKQVGLDLLSSNFKINFRKSLYHTSSLFCRFSGERWLPFGLLVFLLGIVALLVVHSITIEVS